VGSTSQAKTINNGILCVLHAEAPSQSRGIRCQALGVPEVECEFPEHEPDRVPILAARGCHVASARLLPDDLAAHFRQFWLPKTGGVSLVN
jgi:hypothetical protein